MKEKLKYNSRIVTFDLETEGLNLITTRPWQNAWIIKEGKKVIDEREQWIYWPDLQVSKGAAAITRFNHDYYLSKAQDSREMAAEFADVLYDSRNWLCFHNGIGFDLPVTQTWLKLMGLWRGWQDIPKRSLDTLLLARMFHKGIKPQNLLGDQMKELGKPARGQPKANLGALCAEFDIEYDKGRAHDALYDVHRTADIFGQLSKKLDLV